MKPHVLRFQGIGPYPDLVEIDFDQLTLLGLYLIVGPTGAGKSTIFDALSYVLYGDVPSGRSIVSDHEHRQTPMVELEFSHRGSRYLVHREPGLPATENRVAKNPKPNAQRFVTCRSDGSEISAITGTNAVTKEVETLLGLKMKQFNRVILIPQNEFQEFLLASDADKSEILDALFGTEIYKKFADKMWTAAGDLKDRAEKSRISLDQKFENIRSSVDSLVNQELLADAIDARENLGGLIEQIDLLSVHSSGVANEASEVLLAANKAKTLAETEAERFDAHQELVELSARHLEATNTVEVAQSALDRDLQARLVVNAERLAAQARDESQLAIERVATLRSDLSSILSTADVPVLAKLRDMVGSAEPFQLATELNSVIATIKQAEDLYQTMTQARFDLQVAVDNLATTQTQLQTLNERKGTLQADIAERRTAEENANDALRQIHLIKEQIDALDALLLRADVDGAAAVLAAATAERKSADQTFQSINDALLQARRRQSLHRAGELARELQPEQACPVCGSTEHPVLAPLADDDVSIDDLQSAYDKANTANALAENAVRQATEQLNITQVEFARLPSALEQSELRDNYSRLSRLAATSGTLKSEIAKLEAESNALTDNLTAQSNKQAKSEAAVKRLTDEIEVARQSANAIMSEESFDVAKPITDGAIDLVDKIIEASTLLSNNEGAVANSEAQLAATLLEQDFPNVDAALACSLTEAIVLEYQNVIGTQAARSIAIAGLTGKVGDKPVPATRPDVDETLVLLHEAQIHHQKLAGIASVYRENLSQIRTAQSDIGKLGPETLALIKDSEDAFHVAQIMRSGRGALIGVQRWVQKRMFTDVCNVATEQLKILTNQRFEILLNDGDARQGQSLEVCIYDNYTGQVRPVKSMSGGEKFLTSLSMALALAEVVQRMTGGIEIDSLFIDEGFGSLDRSTLDTAVDVLQKLQKGGRTVGVISHVEQMHEELDIGISVSPGARGSTLVVMPGR